MSVFELAGRLAPEERPEGACSDWTFTARAVTIGAHPYEIEADDYALFPAPALRRVASEIPFGHGMLSPGPDYLGEQQIVIPVAIFGATEAETVTNMAALSADWIPADAPFDATVTTPIGSFLVAGKPDPLDVGGLGDVRNGLIHATARWWVTDPVLRTSVGSYVTLSLLTATRDEGHGFSHGYPVGFAYGQGSQAVQWVENAGNIGAGWTAVITPSSALANPSLQLVPTGETLRLVVTVNPGQFLVIDQPNRIVWLTNDPSDLSGAADRSNVVDYPDNGDWWLVPPGVSQVRLAASSGTGTASIYWHSSYLL